MKMQQHFVCNLQLCQQSSQQKPLAGCGSVEVPPEEEKQRARKRRLLLHEETETKHNLKACHFLKDNGRSKRQKKPDFPDGSMKKSDSADRFW